MVFKKSFRFSGFLRF